MSPTHDLLQAAYQRAGRDGVDAVVDLFDPGSNGSPPSMAHGTATTASRSWRRSPLTTWPRSACRTYADSS